MTMTPEEFAEAKSDALGLCGDLLGFATEHGWVAARDAKANKKFAFITLRREFDNAGQHEEIKAFYAIDPDADNDQITHVQPNGVQVVLDPDSGDVRAVITAPAVSADDETDDGDAVPPTSAAHTDIDEDSAAHRASEDLSAAHSAAHQALDEMNAELDVPPTEQTVVEHFGIVPPADEAEVAQEALRHKDAAEKAKKGVHATWSQQDTYAAVRHQQVNPNRNWSAVASPLTTAEILTRLGVNRKSNNLVEIVWLNSLSGTLDRAVVNGAAEKNPPHITPSNFDPDEHGEDLRILHFLEHNGGFRSVAVARIKKIG